MATKFRHPSEYPKKKSRVPISARLDKDVKIALTAAAKNVDQTFSELIENVLEDYYRFLNSSSTKARGR